MPIAWLFCELPVEFLPLQKRYAHTHNFFMRKSCRQRTCVSDAHRLPPPISSHERERDECLLFFSRLDLGRRMCATVNEKLSPLLSVTDVFDAF